MLSPGPQQLISADWVDPKLIIATPQACQSFARQLKSEAQDSTDCNRGHHGLSRDSHAAVCFTATRYDPALLPRLQ